MSMLNLKVPIRHVLCCPCFIRLFCHISLPCFSLQIPPYYETCCHRQWAALVRGVTHCVRLSLLANLTVVVIPSSGAEWLKLERNYSFPGLSMKDMDWMHGSSGECLVVSEVEAEGMPGKSPAWVVHRLCDWS